MNTRGCRRCGAPGLVKRGVQFIVSDARTGQCLVSYDVCEACMHEHSPLIIPAAVVPQLGGVTELRISYAGFGGYQPPTAPTTVR